ncbi:MAG: helix-turn-helix transcriptional regulator [Pseudomonadota bacterium]
MKPAPKRPPIEIAQAALDAFGGPVMVFDAALDVAYTNKAADLLLENGELFHFNEGRLMPRGQDGRTFLQAVRRPKTSGVTRLELSDRSGLVHLYLLRELHAADTDDATYYALYRLGEPLSTQRLMEAYDLTRVEATLVLLLVDGVELTDVGEHLRISRHTARKYLQSVFQKVGVHKQVALVLKVLKECYIGPA